ncbi:hypothetical protein LGQ02_09945 [Bacillus shivajii]|uniref:hypothetical protein n=1 Tax=Bacillus shivajii TaxID=1983719 RepID=UPI001CF98181|nr:hypothetical protein [Bacillus shivajii]UCZ55014.1 hypothetical protein LGQ02_09945 [Bacillus shivajii]
MKSKRKVNKYPYILLGIIHFIILIYTFYKSKDRKRHFVLLMNYAGFAYLFEYVVVALFDGYVYKPKFIKQKNIDSFVGALWSQFSYVPVIALFITVFQLKWRAKLLFAIFFVLIEKTFIRLGIYKNHWWKTKYTFACIFFSFIFNDKWYEQLTKRNRVILFLSYFNTIQVTWMNTVFLFVLLRKIRYGFGSFYSWKEHFKVGPAFGLLVSALLASFMKGGTFISKIHSFLLMSVMDQVLIKKRLLSIKNMFILPIIYVVTILCSTSYRKWVYKS